MPLTPLHCTTHDLKACLQKITYPCYIIAHGPARECRTKFRSEHHGVFASGMAHNVQEAINIIEGQKYPGLLCEMDLIAISCDNGELKETIIGADYEPI